MKPWHPRPAIAAIALAACACLSSAARAEGPRILFVAPASTPFSARVRAEIEAMGFTVEPAEALDADRVPVTVAAARVVEAPPPRRVELWIVDPEQGRFALRTVIQPSSADDDETQIVRASEQLRAFFQPLRAAVPPPPPYTAPPPLPALLPPADPDPSPAPRSPEAPSPRFVAEAAIAVSVQAGGPGADVALRARWMATRAIGVGARVSLPLVGPTITAPEGSARLSGWLFAPELSATFLDTRWLRLGADAGVAAAWLRTTGTARAPYASQSSSLVTALPFVGVAVAPRLADRLRLCLGADVAVSAPRADVVFAGRVATSWARPLGLFSAGVSFDF